MWVKFLDLHFSLWNPNSLSKVASYLEMPIKTDKLTSIKGKLAYTRMLIDMKVSESVPRFIPIEGPYALFKQQVEYEWQPIVCVQCKKTGHTTDQCKKVVIATTPTQTQVSTPAAVEKTVVEKVETIVQNSSEINIQNETVACGTEGIIVQADANTFVEPPKSQKHKKHGKGISAEKNPAAEIQFTNKNPFVVLADQETQKNEDNAFDPGTIPFITNA